MYVALGREKDGNLFEDHLCYIWMVVVDNRSYIDNLVFSLEKQEQQHAKKGKRLFKNWWHSMNRQFRSSKKSRTHGISQNYNISDHLERLRFVINTSTGAIAQRMDYDDWGNVLVNTAPDFTPFGFAGGMYDSQTKLVRFGARDYDPEVGRWTTKDPIGTNGRGLNYYSYSINNPISVTDPFGLSFLDCLRLFNRRLSSMPFLWLIPLSGDYYEGPNGTLIVENKWWTDLWGAWAITYGDMIVMDPSKANDSDTIAHEMGHVAQYENFGPDFYPLYLLDMLLNGYDNSWFEYQADRGRKKHTLTGSKCGC